MVYLWSVVVPSRRLVKEYFDVSTEHCLRLLGDCVGFKRLLKTGDGVCCFCKNVWGKCGQLDLAPGRPYLSSPSATSLKPSYITNTVVPSGYFSIHLNCIQSNWRWRQNVTPKQWKKLNLQNGLKTWKRPLCEQESSWWREQLWHRS